MIFRFDDFEVDTEKFELRQDGVVRPVEPLVFDLISYLSRNPGRVIGRDEVIDGVWKGRIVSDATVAGCVKSARKALGDSGDHQKYIRTVRARGFEFLGVVSSPGRDAAPVTTSEIIAPEAPTAALTVVPADGVDPSPPRPRGGTMPKLAVLPFENLSVETDEYFADGLTEDIITNLSRFRDLLVIARTTTFRFKGRPVEARDLAEQLDVGFVVQGSVRRASGRVRISVQLIDAASGLHLWAERYDRELGDIFEVQDDLTRTIASTLGVTLQDVAHRRAMTRNPAELGAYDLLLRARRYTALLTPEVHAEARDLLEQAVALDPTSADAHALLANVYLAEHRFESNPRPDPIGRAMAMAQTATRLDPQNAYAHCWLAIVHFFRGENDKFKAESQIALTLNPNDPEILADVGHYLAFMGEFKRGTDLSRQAQQLNPLHPGWYHFSFARYHYDRREYLETMAHIERAGYPHFYWTHLLNAAALGQMQRPEAAASLARIFEIKPDFAARTELAKWGAPPHDLEHLMDGLRKAGLDDRPAETVPRRSPARDE